MNIAHIALFATLAVSSASPTSAEEKKIVQAEKKLHSVAAFKKFFKENKDPTTNMIKDAFGDPSIRPLLIEDSIAEQKGQLELTPERAWWNYVLKEKHLSVGIMVFEGKVGNVYIMDSSGITLKSIVLRSVDGN